MRRWLPLLLVMATGCGLLPSAPPASCTHVDAPAGIEAAGSRAPILYLDGERALYFPHGVGGGGARHPVVPSPGELVALGRRSDLVIVTVGHPAVSPTGAP